MTSEEVIALDRKIRNESSLRARWVGLDANDSMLLVQEVYRLRGLLMQITETASRYGGDFGSDPERLRGESRYGECRRCGFDPCTCLGGQKRI